MTDHLKALSDAGVSIWLDDLSRERINTGNLKELIAKEHVVGVTTNPAIFNAAISGGSADYAEQVADLKTRKTDVGEAIRSITAMDVRDACEIFADIYNSTDGYDGRVSIEVDPRLARETAATIAEAKGLHWLVDRENVLIKIPATKEGLPAITEVLANGISVNVTLIFNVDRYEEVIDAWLTGLEKADANGQDLSKIHSVASFFVSRVDSNIDAALDEIGSDEAKALLGQAGIANARLAYGAFEQAVASDRWKALEAKGARVQRPLWASTGVKDPAYADDRYVVELAGPRIVNTMPEATMRAVEDHGRDEGDTISGTQAESQAIFDKLVAAGVDLPAVFQGLEDEGVDKFIVAWNELLDNLQKAIS